MRESDKIDHLLRRTGFGVRPKLRKRAHTRGYRATVQEILQKAQSHTLSENPPATPLPAIVIPATLWSFAQGILWWLETMSKTESPLTEKMTLFWHRHFATSGQKVFHPGWMFRQNVTFRTHGMGPFSELLKEMIHDPALLDWLDANNNPADRPNENLARELLELFTLGIGNYSEKDVKELAKLTTGTRLTLGGKTPKNPKGAYRGPVSILGQKGQLTLEDMAEVLAVHPATAKRMVQLLWADFAASELPSEESLRLERLWTRTRGNVSVVLRAILLSKHFHDSPRQRVTSPVEFWISCCRILESGSFRLKDIPLLEQAGEQLFFPPSVKGWDLGLALIHPAALQTRLEIAQRIVSALPENHFALRGLRTTANRRAFLAEISGGHIVANNLPVELDSFEEREALLLALSSPDLWTS